MQQALSATNVQTRKNSVFTLKQQFGLTAADLKITAVNGKVKSALSAASH